MDDEIKQLSPRETLEIIDNVKTHLTDMQYLQLCKTISVNHSANDLFVGVIFRYKMQQAVIDINSEEVLIQTQRDSEGREIIFTIFNIAPRNLISTNPELDDDEDSENRDREIAKWFYKYVVTGSVCKINNINIKLRPILLDCQIYEDEYEKSLNRVGEELIEYMQMNLLHGFPYEHPEGALNAHYYMSGHESIFDNSFT